MLALPTPSTPRTVLSTMRERRINADKKRVDLDVCLCGRRQGVLNSCDTVSCRKVSLFSLVICVPSRGNRVEFLHLCSSEKCQCAKHCALDFGDFGVLHGVHQCVLGASRVALQLGRCVLLTEGCDQRGILQHLLSAKTRYSRGVRNTGSDLLDCCAADCLGICSAATMTCANGSTAVVWVAGWFLGRGAELLLRYHVRVARVLVVYCARELHRPPTASPVKLGTGVLWVSTGTHPCGPSPRKGGEGTRAPALQHWTTCHDFEEMRNIELCSYIFSSFFF